MSGPFGAGALQYFSGAKPFYDYEIDQSLRFNDNDSAYLQKSFSATGNAKTFTISWWFKRGNVDTNSYWFAGGDNVNDRFHANFNTNGSFQIEAKNSGTTVIKLEGGPVLRDPAAWYHAVIAVDTTQSTSSDRVKMWINNQLIDFNDKTYPSQNTNILWNVNGQVRIGRAGWATNYFDGYMAEFHSVDGTALTPSSFGETKEGIWIPKEYTGSYGTDGFYLAFQDSSNLGDDTSGNGHDFTANNLAATDQVKDTPTNNFCTVNALSDVSDFTLSDGNLRMANTSDSWPTVRGTMGVSSGKWYYEVATSDATRWGAGWATKEFQSGTTFADSLGDSILGYSANPLSYYDLGTSKSINGSPAFTSSDILQVAVDADTGQIWLGINNTWVNDVGGDAGDPAGGTSALDNFGTIETIYPSFINNRGNLTVNFGQDSSFAGQKTAQGNSDGNGIGDFYYTPPSGFLALCTANLPDPGVDPNADENAGDYFNTVIYTGTGASNSIANVGHAPDFVWIKRRDTTGNNDLFDSVRGVQKVLKSNATNAEVTLSTLLTSFDSDGFTIGTNSDLNSSGGSYVAWNWKAGGTAVSNTDGSITSSVSASPESGFSIVSYSGNGTAGATIGHGLGKAPGLIIIKRRNETRNWQVYHRGNTSAPETDKLTLNLADATVDDSTSWNDTAPTASVFTVGTSNGTNNSAGTYIAYCFAEIEGFSKFGTYTGGGSNHNPFVYCGFRPALVIFKQHSAARNWELKDTARDPFNDRKTGTLYANLTNAEYVPSTADADSVDFLSNGFKFRSSAPGSQNVSGGEYIFIAFAEQPFKYANAR